ncbi:YtxH domain-containing protein [Desulforamulus reducens]|uniref:YtxH domain-containing protein n=1 Tax=Desulforamulus reducens TaxID=59610 RepID=UPI0002DC9A19|nr:YtxH domain-containing protein [Desulforamulus reducens]
MGFWRGVITGSLLGAAMGMVFKPQCKPEGLFLKNTQTASRRAQKMMKGMTKKVNDIVK